MKNTQQQPEDNATVVEITMPAAMYVAIGIAIGVVIAFVFFSIR
jgi:hypothetical protein